MSKHFECRILRETDDDGRILAAGAEWTEGASWRHNNVWAAWLGIPFGLFCVLVSLWLVTLSAIAGLVAVGLSVWFTWACFRFATGPLKRRSVIFRAEGKIGVPHGIPHHEDYLWLNMTQAEVGTIQDGSAASGMRHDWTRSIGLITQYGKTVTIGQMLHEEEVREVVVKLTIALRDLRISVSEDV